MNGTGSSPALDSYIFPTATLSKKFFFFFEGRYFFISSISD